MLLEEAVEYVNEVLASAGTFVKTNHVRWKNTKLHAGWESASKALLLSLQGLWAPWPQGAEQVRTAP